MAPNAASANDVQRLFLQALLSRRVVPATLAKILWHKCTEAVLAADPDLPLAPSDDSAQWDAFVARLNTALNPLDLEFRHAQDEALGRQMYALVNRKGDALAQLATDYGAVEIVYFKAIVEQIMLAPREAYSVSSLLALREVSELKAGTMTKAQAEAVLGSFVARGWLLRSKRGRYSLSVRTLLELQTYLKANYEDECLECTVCMELLTRGSACPTRACKARLHAHCLAAFARRAGGRGMACPSCGSAWEDGGALLPVGEAAAREGAPEVRRARAADDGEDDEDGDAQEADEDEGAEDAPPAPSQVPNKEKGAAKRGSRKKARVVEDDDEEEEEAADESMDGAESSPAPQATQKRRSTRRG